MNHLTGKHGNTFPGWVKFNSKEMKDFYLPDTDFIAVNIEYTSGDKYKSMLSEVYNKLFFHPQFSRDNGARSKDTLPSPSSGSSEEQAMQQKQRHSSDKSHSDKLQDTLDRVANL